MTHSPFLDARKAYSQASALRKSGNSVLLAGSNQRLHGVSRDINAINQIGSFILGDMLGDRAAADKLNQSVQMANVALQVGLLVSTGGLSSLAGASSFIPSFFEIKESARREFLSKRIGGVFFEA